MPQLARMMNEYIPGAGGNDTGDHRGRDPGYYYKLTSNGSGYYAISLEAFTESNVDELAEKFRNGRATAEDEAIQRRLMSSYDNYNAEIDTNLYKQFLFLTDPSHPAELNDRALLREALNEYNNWYFDWENNRKVQFDDPILRGNEISCADAYLAAMNGQYKIDWFNLMMAESGMQLAANMMTNAHYNAQSLINGANAKPSWLEADINPETWEGSYGGGGSSDPKFPGNDPYKQPSPEYEWKGDPKKGSWYNSSTKEVLRGDLDHVDPIGGHWDYRAPNGIWYRLYPDGHLEPK